MSSEINETTGAPSIQDRSLLDGPTSKRPLAVVSFGLQTALALSGFCWLGSLLAKVYLASFDDTSTPSWNAAYDRSQLFGLLALALSGVVLTLLIWWTTWAYRNLDISANASENPRQVLLSWFVPILNLLIPVRAIEDLSVGGHSNANNKSQRRLVWYFWLTGPVVFCVRFALLQIEPLVFPTGGLSTALTSLEWMTNFLISTACFVGIVVVRKITAASALW